MQNYKLKLTALTPIHIGTGEVYEPTNFVIDDGYLYEFDEILFFQHLPQTKQIQFTHIASLESDNGYELFEKIHAFIIQNKRYAKEVSINKIKVSRAIERHYRNSIATQVQQEGRGRNQRSVFNKFEIQKTQRLVNNISTFLTGSSIKGAISTAYQEFIYKNHDKKYMNKLFDNDKLFRNLSISDSIAQKADSEIGYAINKEIFETDDNAEISTFIEVNSKASEYLVNLSIKEFKNDDNRTISEDITKEKIIEACNQHYKLLYKNKENEIRLKSNQFLLCLGKHSGARAVTIAGLRKILVKLAQISNKKDEGNDEEKRVERLYKKSHFENDAIKRLFSDFKLLDEKEKREWQNGKDFVESPSNLEDIVRNRRNFTINAILTQETTVWKFGESKTSNDLDSFGWILCEFIDDEEFEDSLELFQKHGEKLIYDHSKSKKEILKNIKREKDLEIAKAIKKEKERKDRRIKEEKDKCEREAKLAAMSPLERKLDELTNNNPSKQAKSVILLQALERGDIEDKDKYETLKIIKEDMMSNNTWRENGNAKKDKALKRTLKMIKLLKECKAQ